jgi:hypothetical protein
MQSARGLRYAAEILRARNGVNELDPSGRTDMRLMMLTFAATLAASAAAYAQEGGPPPGGGGGGPSPEMRALFQQARAACANDMKTLCGDKQGREAMMCLRQNSDKTSQPCKDAMAKLPPPRQRPQ